MFRTVRKKRLPGMVGATVEALVAAGCTVDARAVRQAALTGKQATLSRRGQRVATQVLRNSGAYSTRR